MMTLYCVLLRHTEDETWARLGSAQPVVEAALTRHGDTLATTHDGYGQ